MSKSDIQHEFPLRRVLKPKRGEFQILDFIPIGQVNDLSAVYGISGQPIRMPGDDAIGFALFYSLQHFIEDFPSGFFGSFCLAERGDDFKFFFGGKFF
ncbi:MAG: hypothetical protein WCT08_06640 [Patescibacteria group bacterium]